MITDLSDRQREIIEVSLELIAENGIQGLTIKNLAKKIGFSESAIYRHYENKIQILTAILDYFNYNSKLLLSSLDQPDTDAVSKIQNLLIKQFQVFNTSPSLVAVIFSEELFRNEEILTKKVSEIMNNKTFALTHIIKTGQEKGQIRNDIDASHLSAMVMGSLRLYVKQWHMSNYGFDLIQKGNEFANSISKLLINPN